MDKKLINKLSKLDKNEKLLLVEALWDSIASNPDDVEVPEHHKNILQERFETHEKDKENGDSWEEIRQRYL